MLYGIVDYVCMNRGLISSQTADNCGRNDETDEDLGSVPLWWVRMRGSGLTRMLDFLSCTTLIVTIKLMVNWVAQITNYRVTYAQYVFSVYTVMHS